MSIAPRRDFANVRDVPIGVDETRARNARSLHPAHAEKNSANPGRQAPRVEREQRLAACMNAVAKLELVVASCRARRLAFGRAL